MTSWYHAICDEHREFCSIFIVHQGAKQIEWALGAEDAAYAWLSEHWSCKLRLVRDDNEDDHYKRGYVDKTPP